MLIFVSWKKSAVFFARIVMPRSRSRSFESITRSTTSWLARKMPLCFSIASTNVVLPWSTCAMMAMLRIPLLMFPVFHGAYAPTPLNTKIAAETTSSPDESPSSYRPIPSRPGSTSQVRFPSPYFSRGQWYAPSGDSSRCAPCGGVSAAAVISSTRFRTPQSAGREITCCEVLMALIRRCHLVFTTASILFLAIYSAAQKERPDYSALFDKTEIMIAARDGVKLHTEIYSPKNANEPLPIIFERTPYGLNDDDKGYSRKLARLRS